LAKLFDLQAGRLVMGTSLGDKIVIVIAVLLLAVGGVIIVEVPGLIRRCATRRDPVGFAVDID
jgi:hypothetical protein